MEERQIAIDKVIPSLLNQITGCKKVTATSTVKPVLVRGGGRVKELAVRERFPETDCCSYLCHGTLTTAHGVLAPCYWWGTCSLEGQVLPKAQVGFELRFIGVHSGHFAVWKLRIFQKHFPVMSPVLSVLAFHRHHWVFNLLALKSEKCFLAVSICICITNWWWVSRSCKLASVLIFTTLRPSEGPHMTNSLEGQCR